LRDVDGYKKSRRFWKDKDSDNTRIFAGPVWDFDWAYKDHFGSMLNGTGWMYNYSGGTDVTPPGWYIRMTQDTTFANDVACRYFNLRQTILDTTVMFNYVDSLVNLINTAEQRHFERWPILGVNVGTPEQGTQPTTYAGEVAKFKGWISDRIDFLDANMPGNCYNVGVVENPDRELQINILPNPSNGVFKVVFPKLFEEVNINIYDMNGRVCLQEHRNNIGFIEPDLSQMPAGIYLVQVTSEVGVYTEKVIIE